MNMKLQNKYWTVSKCIQMLIFNTMYTNAYLGSLLETQTTSYLTRSSFQRTNSLVFTESACGRNSIVNTQHYKGRETFPSIHLEFSFFQPEYCLHFFLCTSLGKIAQLDSLSLCLN